MIKLIRDNLSKSGTHGTFHVGGKHWHSLEQPWDDNKPFASCVPVGIYDIVPYFSKKYGDCYIMVNEDLNVFEKRKSPGRPKDGRYKCLFVHRGNYVRNFEGCVGASHAYNVRNDSLFSSTIAACREVNSMVEYEGLYQLEISDV